MKPPPRPDGNGGGVTWDKQVGRPLVNRPALAPQASKQLLRKLEAARQRLDRQTKALEIIAGWRDELRNRISRSRLRFEVIGLPDAEQRALVAEVHDFKRLCRTLAWLGRRQS